MTQFLHGAQVDEVNNGTRAIRTPNSRHQAFIGTAPGSDEADFPMNKPVLVDRSSIAAKLDPNGTLADCYQASADQGAGAAIMIRVPDDADLAAQLTHVVGDPAAQTGVYALRTVNARLGITPRLISAPGFTGARLNGNANPVGATLKALASADRAIAFVDGPDTTEAEAIAARNDYGSDRVFMSDPNVLVFENGAAVHKPSSAYASAATSATDLNPSKGFWWSPSNTELKGVVGTNRPISFGLSNPETEANRLNENGIATVIHRNGYRLWGNRSTAIDPNWAFLSVRRTADQIYTAIEDAFLYAMDRPITKQTVVDIRNSVDAYLRDLTALGAILGGKCYLDAELNTETALKAGKLYMNFDFEPPAPLEHLIFRAYRNGDYYDELINDVAQAA